MVLFRRRSRVHGLEAFKRVNIFMYLMNCVIIQNKHVYCVVFRNLIVTFAYSTLYKVILNYQLKTKSLLTQ